MMNKNSKIYVAGHRGLVGSSIVRKLHGEGFTNIIYRTSDVLDLTDQNAVEEFFRYEEPEYVFLAAAKVGGIVANRDYPADFIYINTMIQNNVIHNAYKFGVKKLLFLGSSCIYPKYCTQPMKEEYLLTGSLEPSNEAYAIAKIAGLKMCQYYNKQYGTNFISCMPTNLYGPNDNFDLETSHVMPALIRKFHEAKIENRPYVEVWGTGTPKREFLYVDDMADACVFLMNNYDGNETVNIGTGAEVSIGELAKIIKEAVGFNGEIRFDPSKPDGTPRKLQDVSRLTEIGWKYRVPFNVAVSKTYKWYVKCCT